MPDNVIDLTARRAPHSFGAYAPDPDAIEQAIETAEERFRAGLLLGRKLERQDAGRIVRDPPHGATRQTHGHTGLWTLIIFAAAALAIVAVEVFG